MDGAERREDGARGTEGEEGESSSEKDPQGPPSTQDSVSRDLCCEDCGETFMEESAYLEHRSQHQKETLCSDDQLGDSHNAEKDCETPHLCTLCSLSFDNLTELHLHMENHAQVTQEEPGVQSKQPVYDCVDCGKSYGVLGNLLNHRRSHRLPSKSVFHDLEHLKKKSFRCEFCGRSYSRASALDAHRRYHEEKLVKSKIKSLQDVAETGEPVVEIKQSEDQAEDYSEKPFKCACGKAFSALMRLKTHQRFSRNSQCSPQDVRQKTKKSINEFYCTECDKTFSSHIALFNHQRWHANRSDTPAQRFPCEECGKEFMTLTFYYKHQRMAHSKETPAKSFLHQVCQLQKKAFECKDCGLKFSRASALHSHQLQHSEAFSEPEKDGQVNSSLSPQQKVSDSESNRIEHQQPSLEETVQSKIFLHDDTPEPSHISENEDDMDSYEPGDFNIQVISASESEDEPLPNPNPDLELVCESDQDLKDDGDADFSTGRFIIKPDIDLKIVQIDLEQADEQCEPIIAKADNKERFDCPQCDLWFSSSSSLHVHRLWHGVHRRKRQSEGQSPEVHTCDICGHRASSYSAHYKHIQTHSDQEPNKDSPPQSDELEKNFACIECGKTFSRLSVLVAHQLRHPKKKEFQCPNCMMSYLHAATLFNHMKTCSAQKTESSLANKKEYNPKKTLLGPKLHHCEQCGKGFWSLGAYSHHKQSQTECADLKLRKGFTESSNSGDGYARSPFKVTCPVCGRKFRQKRIMALHMRKHENGNHKCELCNRSFRLVSSLLRHQVVHSDQLFPPPVKSFQHQVEQLQKNTYGCPDCGKLFSRAKALQFHLKSHGYETGHALSPPGSTATLKDLQCATCFAHFSNRVSLKAHRKLCIKRGHQEIKEEESSKSDNAPKDNVDVGTKEVSHPSQVEAEVKSEFVTKKAKMENSANKRKYQCNKCERSFSVAGALNFHKKVHGKGRKSQAKANSVRKALFQNAKEEPNRNQFQCPECGRQFLSNAALGSHKRWHGKRTGLLSLLKDGDSKLVSQKSEDGRFRCLDCGKQFFNHRVLQRHYLFNPQCQNKVPTGQDSNKSQLSSSSTLPEQTPESDTFVQSSVTPAHHEEDYNESADRQGNNLFDCPELVDKSWSGEASSVRPKLQTCPICSMNFLNTRGLRAHQWQMHSKTTKSKKVAPLSHQMMLFVSDIEEDKRNNSSFSAVESAKVTTNKSSVGREENKSPGKSVSCLECGKQCSCLRDLLDHKKVCIEITHDSKLEIRTPEAASEVSPPPGHMLEHTVKCFFKCNKCGKAFQTVVQLETHKIKAKHWPYCCALCCQGFCTENQLQEHLAWHDEVRCRLPNEVRYRLGAALPLKITIPAGEDKGNSLPSSTTSQPPPQPAGQSKSSHKCQRCGKAFLSPTALQKHKTQHCIGTDLCRCSFCPKTFSEVQELIDHHQECISTCKRE